jgi:UDP-galactopyranose mutase
MMTLHQIYGVTTPAEGAEVLNKVKIPINNPTNLEDWCLSQIGKELYELLIKGYTQKQWGRNCRDLPTGIIRRLPIRLTYDDKYHESLYTGQPENGYTEWIQNIIGDCPVEIGTDFFKLNWAKYASKLVYSGPIDEFYDYHFGKLEYRTLRFEEKVLNGDYQGMAQMNYTNVEVPYTRITEHKHFNFKNQPKTVVTFEYPSEWQQGSQPYYPIGDEKNNAVYAKYHSLIDHKTIIGGRLGSYRYMDMDAVIASAIKKSEEFS